jgi:hypothetical protein
LVEIVAMFFNQAIIIEELLTHLLCHVAADFPCSRGEVAAEGESTRDVKNVGYVIAECTNHIRVVLELAKA